MVVVFALFVFVSTLNNLFDYSFLLMTLIIKISPISILCFGGIGDIQLTVDDHNGGKGGGAIMVVSHSAKIYARSSRW